MTMLAYPDLVLNTIKVFTLGGLSLFVALAWSPLLTHVLYKYKVWKKKSGKGKDTPIFNKLHKDKDVNTPRMGGLLIWVTTVLLAGILWALHMTTDIWWLDKLNFLDRGQTWLPLFALVTASVIGFLDDLITVKSQKGIAFRYRVVLVTILGAIGAWWFYTQLGVQAIHFPGIGDWVVGIWIVPIFIIAMLVMFSTSVIDGLDGLSGGVFITIFLAYMGIALFRGQINIAALCAVIIGALFVFLWFNIPPARFYMTETGILGLTVTITVIAFLTDSIAVLPIVALVPILEGFSVVIQRTSKKLRNGKKVFLIAPIHHHFEAIGWPAYKVTMRFWLVSGVAATVGFVIAILGTQSL